MVDVFLRGDVAILFTVVSLLLGAVSLYLTPREEEPQIVVPMADVFVQAPGLSAEEVERQVTERVEKLLYQIDGVEYVYSVSRPGECVVTVRFYVGENREDLARQTLQQDQRQCRPDSADRQQLGHQTDRDRRRADRHCHAVERPA